MEESKHSEHLKNVKRSITQIIQSKVKRESTKTFMDGYNAVYQICTDEAHEKYTIEGGEVYQIYAQLLSRYLETFPSDYTLEMLAGFMARYRRNSEKICKMLSFITRYFIRINMEVSNANVQTLKKVYATKIFDIVLQQSERSVYDLFAEKFMGYLNRKREVNDKQQQEKTYWQRQIKILRLFIQEYTKIAEIAEQKRSIKNLCEKIVQMVAEEISNQQSTYADNIENNKNQLAVYNLFYQKLAIANGLFAQRDRKKKIFCCILAKKMDPYVLKGFMSHFVSFMFRKSINQKIHTELVAFYNFADHSGEGRKAFANAFMLAIMNAVKKSKSCIYLVRFFIFIKQHLLHMPRVDRKIRRSIELVFLRRVRDILQCEEDADRFEKDLIEVISEQKEKLFIHTNELSLFISAIPEGKNVFWKKLIADMKCRLLIEDRVEHEKSLILNIARRIERCKGVNMKQKIEAPEEVVKYIDFANIYSHFFFYDTNNFEEILMCIRDVEISEMHFKRESAEFSTDCRLLTYTRWDCPTMDMNVPCEIEDLWINIQKYCQEKGRKFQLNMCPTVSSAILHVNNSVIICDLLQASIIILLGKTGPLSIDQIVISILPNPLKQSIEVLREKLEALVAEKVLVQKKDIVTLNIQEMPDKVDTFGVVTKRDIEDNSTGASVRTKDIVEAFIVRSLKHSSGMELSKVIETIQNKFSVSAININSILSNLQEKGYITQKDNMLFYAP